MIRAITLCFALGLTPALAEDLDASGSAQMVEDYAMYCDGPCPEAGPTAMSSDEDGDGEAEYVTFTDETPCGLEGDMSCEAQADASSVTETDATLHL